ncbi:MAG: nuclear transport factor 2 family protein [Oscillospiraceae bacterium]|nr:nuclear transport factor 2 family protein [Oscillospiraceae bacterium]
MEKAIHDYVVGWYDKDSARMTQGVHPLLVKRHPDAEAPNGIISKNKSSLLEALPIYGGVKGKERRLDIELFDSAGNIATARAVSNEYVDYIHLVNTKGSWKIINVLWDFHEKALEKRTDTMKSDMEKPLRDYVEGWYDKDIDRVKRGLHPDLAKRSINPENPDIIDEFTRSSLLDVVPQYGGSNGDHRVLDIEWLNTQQNIASAKVISNNFIDYIHLCRINDQWKIVNVLWAFL